MLLTYLDAATPVLQEARESLRFVKSDELPADLKPKIGEVGRVLSFGERVLHDLRAMATLALSALGHDRPRTYLVLFQNQTELRPTGGFMGSYAEVVFDRGDIKRMTIPGGGPYDLRDQLRYAFCLQAASARVFRWSSKMQIGFRFSNGSEKFDGFESCRSTNLDGVVAVNSSILKNLGHHRSHYAGIWQNSKRSECDAGNAKAVELEYDKTENKPKVCGELVAKVLERVRHASGQDQLCHGLCYGSETKEIQIALSDERNPR